MISHIMYSTMSSFDYTGRPESSRATIQMTHSAQGPVVSFEEAQRIERETAEHLLKSRRLSLIVDLDQTIVHATVDPTVGEWIAEGEAWEERRAERERRREERENRRRAKAGVRVNGVVKEGEGDDEGDDAGDESGASSVEESDTEEDGEDEVNPNWEALKDVKKFRLAPDTFGNARPPASPKGKEKSIQSDGCLYYVKPR
jgi:RNA polymerase II subunit A-like phosphatase